MKRTMITIDETKCTGCGLCIPNCPEGALQILDGKARLISDLFCDGLGACMGHCPEGAITTEEREAEPYDERRVMENIIKAGDATIKAHLKHLRDHDALDYLSVALTVLQEKNIKLTPPPTNEALHQGCPGTNAVTLERPKPVKDAAGTRASALSHWPVQLHLISPAAAYFRNSDLLVAADCVAFTVGDFHKDFLSGKTLVIACPKLDSNQQSYLQKLVALIDEATIKSLTVITMEVPCCSGLLQMVQRAIATAQRRVPLTWIKIGIKGEVQERRELGGAAPQSVDSTGVKVACS